VGSEAVKGNLLKFLKDCSARDLFLYTPCIKHQNVLLATRKGIDMVLSEVQASFGVQTRKIGRELAFGLSGLGLGAVCIFTLSSFEAFVLSIMTIGTGAILYTKS
jgi:hypothetical protein